MKASGLTLVIGLLVLLGLVIGAGWGVWKTFARSDDPLRLLAKWVFTALSAYLLYKILPLGIFGLLVGLVMAIILSILWAPHLGASLSKPLTSILDGGNRENEARPLYSIAEARRKQGKYSEAMSEIQTQLQKFPNDFGGWMMLAEIQAENLKDLSGAQETIEFILSQDGHWPKNIAYALNRLADWHLKIGEDRESARSALERIVELLPETEQTQLARQRIAHLMPQERIDEKHEPHQIPLPPQDEHLGLRQEPLRLPPTAAENPAVIAANYVKHLEVHPHDYEARENLALIYAKHFQRLDLASDQFEQLLAVPHQPSRQVVRWLNLLADLQVQGTGEVDLARKTLQRIVDQFPKTAWANTALTRMAYLNLEVKGKQKGVAVKLGSYEQNIGLQEKKPTEGDAGQSAYRFR